MRVPRHFSPTSFDLYEKDKEAYYLSYLSERRFDKEPQSMPMAIGSAFDFLVKDYLIKNLVSSKLSGNNAEMKAQIDKHNLPEAMEHGKNVFELYRASGALAAISGEIIKNARFEFGVTGAFVEGKLVAAAPELDRKDFVGALILNGRPDGYYQTRAKFESLLVDVIHDWKVNGWLSSAKSPDPGYVSVHCSNGQVKGQHKDCFIKYHEGIKINGAAITIPESWRKQLSIYGWCLGVPIGTPMLGSIDQVIGPAASGRVAKHRFLISGDFQHSLFERMVEAWEIVNSNWIFRDMPKEASVARCAALETQVVSGPEDNSWMEGIGRER